MCAAWVLAYEAEPFVAGTLWGEWGTRKVLVDALPEGAEGVEGTVADEFMSRPCDALISFAAVEICFLGRNNPPPRSLFLFSSPFCASTALLSPPRVSASFQGRAHVILKGMEWRHRSSATGGGGGIGLGPVADGGFVTVGVVHLKTHWGRVCGDRGSRAYNPDFFPPRAGPRGRGVRSHHWRRHEP